MTCSYKDVIHILLIEDDRENLKLLMETLPRSINGYDLVWEPCEDFNEAVRRVSIQRFDLIVTDIYRDRSDRGKGVDIGDEKALDVIEVVRSKRFCPIVVFTDGSAPQSFKEEPFLKFADKSGGNDDIVSKVIEILATGIPMLARKLHDELDRATGSYLWDFLVNYWDRLCESVFSDKAVLERLIRRRASVQLGRLNPSVGYPVELTSVEGVEFYIFPPISGDVCRLGEIIQHKETRDFRVVLTPHCYLTIQPGDKQPRADYVLTVKTLPAEEAIRKAYTDADGNQKNPWKGDEKERQQKLKKRIKSPADLGRPTGRFWFLPRFLNIPDMYCDFLQLESIPLQTLKNDYDRVAVLDTPFAEALQSCFTQFYSTVGLPNLNFNNFMYMIKEINETK